MLKISRRDLLSLSKIGLTAMIGWSVLQNLFSKNKNSSSQKQPVLFLGHGSPLNAIENNPFTQKLNSLGQELEIPKAILCISAHWLTKGTYITSAANPKMIYDMYGFPEPLYQLKYPAPGNPQLAEQICNQIKYTDIKLDQGDWGLDHGTWSVLVHLYPQAQIPVLQMSIDRDKPPEFHYELGKALQILRDQGVMIIGSGNVVHNLRKIDFQSKNSGYPWAKEFDLWIKENLTKTTFEKMVKEFYNTEAGKLSIPTTEHYYPLLYVLGAAQNTDILKMEYEGLEYGSLSMRSFSLRSQS
jgi:4,5-DOPA dioxygenase extradiol